MAKQQTVSGNGYLVGEKREDVNHGERDCGDGKSKPYGIRQCIAYEGSQQPWPAMERVEFGGVDDDLVWP